MTETIPPVTTNDVSQEAIQRLITRLAACTMRDQIQWETYEVREPREYRLSTPNATVAIAPHRMRLYDRNGYQLRDNNYPGVNELYGVIAKARGEMAISVIDRIIAELDRLEADRG